VKPHWPLAAAVNSAICVALAGPAVTRLAGLGLAVDDGFVAALAVVALGAGAAVRPAPADDVELTPPQAAAKHKTPTVSPPSKAALTRRRVPGPPRSYATSA